MNMKTCSKCKGEFPATTEYWHRNKAKKDGFADYCKPCNREANLTASRRLVTDPNTGEVVSAGNLSKRKFRFTPEGLEKSRKASALSKRRLVTDPNTGEVIKASALSTRRRWANGKRQEYLDNNPLYKLRQGLSSLISTSMRRRGWSKSTKTQQLVGCSFSELMNHLKQSLPTYVDHDVIHIDHILPCNCAENEDELNALQHYTNLQWLPGAENLSKSDTLPPDWKERKAKLMAIYFERFPERREAA